MCYVYDAVDESCKADIVLKLKSLHPVICKQDLRRYDRHDILLSPWTSVVAASASSVLTG